MAGESVRILHTADLHLGTTFRSVGDRATAEVLRREHGQILPRLVQQVHAQAIDVVLMAGDVFDTPTPEPQLVARFMTTLEQMAPAEVFVCAGNHDPCLLTSFWREQVWPPHVHFMGAGEPERVHARKVPVTVDGFSFTDLYAEAPFPTREQLAGLTVDPERAGDYRILLLHGEVAASSHYNAIQPERLSASYDYLALGHIHLPQMEKHARGDGIWCYPGTPQGRGFDETGSRGYQLGKITRVETSDGQVTYRQDWVHRPLSMRPFMIREIDIEACVTEAEITASIRADLEGWAEALGPEDGFGAKDALVRVRLVGRPRLEFPVDVQHHRGELMAEGWFYLEIEDHTKVYVDREALRHEAGFNALLMELMDRYREQGRFTPEQEARVLELIMRTEGEVRDDFA